MPREESPRGCSDSASRAAFSEGGIFHHLIEKILQSSHGRGSASGSTTFPQDVQTLMEADGYAVDFRRSTRTYYMPDGQSFELTESKTVLVNALAVRLRL